MRFFCFLRVPMASNDTDIQLRIRAAVEGLAEISKLIAEVDTLGGETESSSEQVGVNSDNKCNAHGA